MFKFGGLSTFPTWACQTGWPSSSVREVLVQLLRFEIKLNISHVASVGACDRPTLGVHTPPVARTCFWVQLVHVHACTHVWLKAHEKGLLHAHVLSVHLAFSTLMFLPSSPLSSDILFDTAFQSLTFTDLLPGLSRPKSAGPMHFHNGEEDFWLHGQHGPFHRL